MNGTKADKSPTASNLEPSTQESTITIEDDLPDYLLVSSSLLLALFRRCAECGQEAIASGTFTRRLVGSALILKWHCLFCGKDCQWASQPGVELSDDGENLKEARASDTTELSVPINIDNLEEQLDNIKSNSSKETLFKIVLEFQEFVSFIEKDEIFSKAARIVYRYAVDNSELLSFYQDLWGILVNKELFKFVPNSMYLNDLMKQAIDFVKAEDEVRQDFNMKLAYNLYNNRNEMKPGKIGHFCLRVLVGNANEHKDNPVHDRLLGVFYTVLLEDANEIECATDQSEERFRYEERQRFNAELAGDLPKIDSPPDSPSSSPSSRSSSPTPDSVEIFWRYKTELCDFGREKCQYGKYCTYAHSMEEQRCKYQARCTRGPAVCYYIHDETPAGERIRQMAAARAAYLNQQAHQTPPSPSRANSAPTHHNGINGVSADSPLVKCPFCKKKTAKIVSEKHTTRKYYCTNCFEVEEKIRPVRLPTRTVPVDRQEICQGNKPVEVVVQRTVVEIQTVFFNFGTEKWRAVLKGMQNRRRIRAHEIETSHRIDQWSSIALQTKGHVHRLYQEIILSEFKYNDNLGLSEFTDVLAFFAYAGVYYELARCVVQRRDCVYTAARVGPLIFLSNIKPHDEKNLRGLAEEEKERNELQEKRTSSPLKYNGSQPWSHSIKLTPYRLVKTELQQEGSNPVSLFVLGDVDVYIDKNRGLKEAEEVKAPEKTKEDFMKRTGVRHTLIQTHLKNDLRGFPYIKYRYAGGEHEELTTAELLTRGQELEEAARPPHIPPEKFVREHDILRAHLANVLRAVEETLVEENTYAEIRYNKNGNDGKGKITVTLMGALDPRCLSDVFRNKFGL